MRRFSLIDHCIQELDKGLKTLVPGSATAQRPEPGAQDQRSPSDREDKRHAACLMRINHTGEVCAQALYQGQAATARDPAVKQAMQHSAEEEVDHLAWCEQRLKELDSQPSVLNPLFYTGSWLMGAAAGLAGDRISLGFVAATEDQVCEHLREHLEKLPESDERSRAILEQMLSDEAAHASKAIEAGGQVFPPPVKRLMSAMSQVMTRSTYRI